MSRKDAQNSVKLLAALTDLGFDISEDRKSDVISGKDFVEIKDGSFDIDLIFAPDGIERFDDAWSRRVDTEGLQSAILMTSLRANRLLTD